MKWHYLTGIVFGLLTFTWVFSGLLSMEPWNWASADGISDALRTGLSGERLDLKIFPPLDAAAMSKLAGFGDPKEVEFTRLQDDPYYIVRTSTNTAVRVSARTFLPRTDTFSADSLLAKIRQTEPRIPIEESVLLNQYDSYYYASIDRDAPLPVLRVKLGDPRKTWVYLDATTSQLVRSIQRKGRIERWLYHGFHSLDFSFLYYRRPVWDAVMITLSLGGAAMSAIGMFVGFGRFYRGVKRLAKGLLPSLIEH